MAIAKEPSSAEMPRHRTEDVAATLKALSHPTRLLIACELLAGEKTASDLETRIDAAHPVISRDLARCRARRLVASRRDDKRIFHSIADPRLRVLIGSRYEGIGPKSSEPKGRNR